MIEREGIYLDHNASTPGAPGVRATSIAVAIYARLDDWKRGR